MKQNSMFQRLDTPHSSFSEHSFSELVESIIKQEGSIERVLPAKTLILKEGEISTHLHVIRKGCLRLWLNKEGKDITAQFFFEGQVVSSIDSLISNEPSQFNLECIEPSVVVSINKEDMMRHFMDNPDWRNEFERLLYQRFKHYAQLFISRIRDTPQERYMALVSEHPEIIKRIPQHYIASYLGITPVSLSRIRNRK